MIKLYAAVKMEDGEEYSVMWECAHTAVLSDKKGMVNMECTM